MLKSRCTLGAGALVMACAAVAVERPEVEEMHVLLVAALQSPQGTAVGIFGGPMFRMMREHFKTDAPLLVDVTTIQRYAQPGCARLNLQISQQAVRMTATAAPEDRFVDLGLNYCTDGMPPKSLQMAR